MKTPHDTSSLTLIDAVETLSDIAEMDPEALAHSKTVDWLDNKSPEEAVDLVQENFRVIVNYLRQIWKKEISYAVDSKKLDGIKTIMVLVAEAAKKIDRYTSIFHKKKFGSVTELREYKQLQDFYRHKISRTIDEGKLGRWILALSRRNLEEKPAAPLKKGDVTKHIFVEMDSVKKDTDYELFFLKKEDGTRFFSPRLIRNIKLVCDFGTYLGEDRVIDPLVDIRIWQDQFYHNVARNTLKAAHEIIPQFYSQTLRHKESHELVPLLNKGIMALMMAANSKHLMNNGSTKLCGEYFIDFLRFLRAAMQTDEYKKLVAYPPTSVNKVDFILFETINRFCEQLYMHVESMHDFGVQLNKILGEPAEGSVAQLERDYVTMQRTIRQHPNGPLTKVLNLLSDPEVKEFDPLHQYNIPGCQYVLHEDDRKIANIRMPTPLRQEYVNKCQTVEEFKAMLRTLNNEKFLLINLQDRTSWKEQARSLCLEELQNCAEFKDKLVVATLACDNEFYQQAPPFDTLNRADQFMKEFERQILTNGYNLPEEVCDDLGDLIHSIHRIVYGSKNVLTKDNRREFIEIVNLCLVMRIIDSVKPGYFALSCKDGLEAGQMMASAIFAITHMLSEKGLTHKDIQYLNLMIYGPSLIVRERLPQNYRIKRLLGVLKAFESVRNEHGAEQFRKLFRRMIGEHSLKAHAP